MAIVRLQVSKFETTDPALQRFIDVTTRLRLRQLDWHLIYIDFVCSGRAFFCLRTYFELEAWDEPGCAGH